MTRWMRPADNDRQNAARFDPIAIAAELGLARDVAQALWEQVCEEIDTSSHGVGRKDEHEKFLELARRIARTKQSKPGRFSSTDVASRVRLTTATRTLNGPGRQTRVDERREAPLSAVPGRVAPVDETHDELEFDDFRVLGLRDVLRALGTKAALRVELVATAARENRDVAGRAAYWQANLDASPSPDGAALLQASERHAATLYRRATSHQSVDATHPDVVAALQLRGDGEPLSPEVREELERSLGVSLGGVRLHHDGVAARAARVLSAEAFTLGEDIFFAEGMFAPETTQGRKLLVHELAHVAQAARGRTSNASSLQVSRHDDELEREAQQIAERHDATAAMMAARPSISDLFAGRGAVAAKRTQLPDRLRARMEDAFGQRFSELEIVDASPEVPVGSKALTRERRVHLEAGAVDWETAAGVEVLAHELAHVVQQRGVGNKAGTRHELEVEASSAAATVAQGGRATIALRAEPTATYGYGKTKDEKAGPSRKDLELPPGVNHRLYGTAGAQIVRTAWYMDGATVEGDRVRNPSKMLELNEELKQLFWWMTDAQVEASKTFYIGGAPLPEPAFIASLTTQTFQSFGLPPGTDIVWKKEADGGVSLVLSIRNAGINQPPASASSVFTVEDELRQRVDEQFAKTFGVVPASPLLSAPTLGVKPQRWAWVLTYDKNKIAALVGPAWANAKNIAPSDPTTEDSSVFGGVSFPNTIPLSDRQYYIQWMEATLGKQAPSGGAGSVEIDDALIRAMRQLDKEKLLKEQVIERMRRAQSGGGFVLDSTSFRRLVHETKEEQERIRLGLQPQPATGPDPSTLPAQQPYASPHEVQAAPRARYYERAITGKIVNLGSLASVGKSLDLYFATEDPQGLGFVGVTIQWYATPTGEPSKRVREGRTFHYAHHNAENWSVTFDKVGTYEITAIVDHQSYWPTTFKSSIDVQTEESRLAQVEQKAFGGLGANTKTTEEQHFFDVSFTNDRFGPNKYTFGKLREGELPKDFTPQTLDQHLGFMSRDRDALKHLIETYKERTDSASKDVVAYAQAALERLDESEKEVRADAKDLVPFEIRGAFLSEKNGVKSGDLTLVGLAGTRHKSKTYTRGKDDLVTKEWDQPTVRIHDMSQLYEPKNAVYTGEADDFRASAERAFIDLCKSYPPGRISVLMEQVTKTGARTGKTLGFELHTGTAWKDVKEVVWDSKAQIIVNLVGAAAAIFIPGAGAVVAMALVTAYNAVDTVDNLAALKRKGQATTFDSASAFVSIGLDVIPFAGELKAVGRLGKSTLFALDAAQVAKNVIVMTAEGVTQVRALRDQHVKHIAELQGEVETLRKQNDSSLELATKERELKAAIAEAQQVASSVFVEMGASGAVMMMAPLAFNHMLKGFAKAKGGELAKSDLFIEGTKGETPHYDAKIGKIRGDSSLLTPELTSKLNEAWTLDVYAKHADAANVLGVAPHEVVLKRDPKATKTTARKNADGVWEITAPEGRTHEQILDDVWHARQQLPDAPSERPKALERGSYEPTFSIDDILKTGKPALVGNRMESRGDAEAVLRKLAAGDRSALKRIGLDKLPKGFDPRSVEWGLGVLPDGKYVLVRGDAGSVDWGPFPEVRPLAHSHPLRANKMLRSDGGPVGIHVLDMVRGGGSNEHNKVDFFPSASDVAFCHRNALATHTVETPYVHLGDGRVGNPVGDFAGKPRVSIEIRGAQRIGSFEGADAIPAYQAHVVVRDTTGKVIWEGEMIAVHHPLAGSLIQFGAPPAHWVKPGLAGVGMGGETGAPIRKPRTKADQLAYSDWQALEKAGKNYRGKFDGDEWYGRYEDGLRYDLDTDRWVRPDGRKVRDPQKFDSRKWTKKTVYDHLAGPDSESTFKPFAEMLIREKIATRAQIEKMIEKKGFLGRDENAVRHELKVEYRDAILAKMNEPRTAEGKHAAMRRLTENLDSADKGNITEVWYRENVLGGSGETHVAARKDTLKEDQGIKISKDRFVDIVDGSIGHEIKSGDGKLSDGEVAQMIDYAKMVDGQAVLPTEGGDVTIKHVRYTFTSSQGAKANATAMREAFKDPKRANRISFELFSPQGKTVTVRNEAQLNAQAWLFE